MRLHVSPRLLRKHSIASVMDISLRLMMTMMIVIECFTMIVIECFTCIYRIVFLLPDVALKTVFALLTRNLVLFVISDLSARVSSVIELHGKHVW